MKIFFKFLGGVVSVVIVGLLMMWCYEVSHMEQYTAPVTQDKSQGYAPQTRSEHVAFLETVQTDDGYTMRYIDQGANDAPVLLLVHGTPTNSRLYRKMIPGLVAEGWRVIVPDMIGFGASDKPDDMAQYTVAKQSQRLSDLMKHLGVQKYTIAGHDQGSLRVRDLVANTPEVINHLIIFNSIADRSGFHPPAGFGKSNMMTKLIAPAMGSKGLGRVFAYGALAGGVNDMSVITTHMIDGYLLPLMQGTDRTYYQFISDFEILKSSVEKNMQTLSTINIPSTIIRGADDPILVADEQVPVIQEILNTSEGDIYILDSAKHFIQEEQPHQIIEILNGMIQQRYRKTIVNLEDGVS